LLLYAAGMKIPGRRKKIKKYNYISCNNSRRARIVLAYCFLIALLILLCFLLIRLMVRGDV